MLSTPGIKHMQRFEISLIMPEIHSEIRGEANKIPAASWGRSCSVWFSKCFQIDQCWLISSCISTFFLQIFFHHFHFPSCRNSALKNDLLLQTLSNQAHSSSSWSHSHSQTTFIMLTMNAPNTKHHIKMPQPTIPQSNIKFDMTQTKYCNWMPWSKFHDQNATIKMLHWKIHNWDKTPQSKWNYVIKMKCFHWNWNEMPQSTQNTTCKMITTSKMKPQAKQNTAVKLKDPLKITTKQFTKSIPSVNSYDLLTTYLSHHWCP